MNKTSGKKIILPATIVAAILAISLFAAMVPMASAATEEEIQEAIYKGVAWLAAQQKDDGSWGYSYPVAETAFAVKKLEHHAVDCKYGHCLDSPFDPAYPYAENVQMGLDYIFTNANIIDGVPVRRPSVSIK